MDINLISRYVCVCLTIVLSNVSPRVKKRFPTWEHFVDAGLLLDNELTIFQHLNEKFPKPSKHWLPIIWASSIVTRARNEGRIRDDFAVKTLIDELNKFRGMCGSISHYDTISVPLVYTQVNIYLSKLAISLIIVKKHAIYKFKYYMYAKSADAIFKHIYYAVWRLKYFSPVLKA